MPATALITITEKAAVKAKQLLAKHGVPAGAVRLKVTSGGCSGFSYNLEPTADEPQKGDQVVEAQGLRVYLDPKSLLFVAGTELDYESTLMSQKFVFKNPNASSSCSCGESFSV